MIQIHKSKSPCPTALAKGQSKCLGASCPWFVSNQEAGIADCIVALQGATIINLVDELESLKAEIKGILEYIASTGPLLEENLEALEELKARSV